MTSRKQSEANRRNASKSTGPRSANGKARASKNARKHGLNAPPDPTTVREMYRIVLGDPEAVPNPFSDDPFMKAALELAYAEAHLMRVKTFENVMMEDFNSFFRGTIVFGANGFDGDELLGIADAVFGFTWKCARPTGPVQPHEIHLLTRYRDEAEVRRLKALRNWRLQLRLRPSVRGDLGSAKSGADAKQPANAVGKRSSSGLALFRR